jgi:hypothetical protein
MGWVLPTNDGKVLGCDHNLQRRIEYRFTGKDIYTSAWLTGVKVPRVAQPGDEIVFLCPYGCEEISILVTSRHANNVI